MDALFEKKLAINWFGVVAMDASLITIRTKSLQQSLDWRCETMRAATLIATIALISFSGLVTKCDASAITSVVAGPGTGGPAEDPRSGQLDSSSVEPTGLPLFGDSTGTIDMDVTVFAKHRPFAVTMNMLDTTAFEDPDILSRTYTFTVTVTNGIGDGTAANPDQNGAAFDEIQNIEFSFPTATNHLFAAPYSPASSPALIYAGTVGGVASTILRFGGIRGGGPAIPSGGSMDFGFSIVTSNTDDSFDLSITANPEPTSLALAGLGICLVGGVGVARRRFRRKTNDDESSLDEVVS